jgi:hypothetical protein
MEMKEWKGRGHALVKDGGGADNFRTSHDDGNFLYSSPNTIRNTLFSTTNDNLQATHVELGSIGSS